MPEEGRESAGVERKGLRLAGGHGHSHGRAEDPRGLEQEQPVDWTQHQGQQPAPEEPFDRLLRAQDDQGLGAEEETAHVRGNVVQRDDGHGEHVPNHAVVHGVEDQGGLEGGEQDEDVRPSKVAVLDQAL